MFIEGADSFAIGVKGCVSISLLFSTIISDNDRTGDSYLLLCTSVGDEKASLRALTLEESGISYYRAEQSRFG